jgi:endonuclease/exonuclease/phosphatase (EEP) superfamily protein YafD
VIPAGNEIMATQRFVLLLPLGGLCAATVFALLAPLGWPFELFTHFRVQYAAFALVLTPALLWLRHPRAAAFAGVLALFHALPAAEDALASEPAATCDGPVVTVVTANVQFSNGDHRAFLEWLASHPADLVVVQEVTAAWAAELSRQPGYPHRKLVVREDPYGIGVMSRWPLDAVTQADLAGDGLPSLGGRLDAGGHSLQFLALHTQWPVTPALARARDDSLREAAKLIRDRDLQAVALGDLNLTPYSPVFERFLHQSGLHDALDGRQWRPTWLAGFWPLALPIDHVLVSPQICVERAEVGPPIGSDHRPVIAQLRLPARAAR